MIVLDQVLYTKFVSEYERFLFHRHTEKILLQKSNLRQHVKAVHEEVKPFACSFSGCGMRFSYKHVRDNHEKSGCHTYIPVSYICQWLDAIVSFCLVLVFFMLDKDSWFLIVSYSGGLHRVR